eukprot:TRINITY_DN6400_c1_g2_i1.p1 TRINITY_DN6400_c1_g2~~TRINITY_DN6400_c1_g2_i1.p1  ORF type:complete len:293 (+),score=19.57 TRINITY_DN6400_c1_g2_i1:40-918(+)
MSIAMRRATLAKLHCAVQNVSQPRRVAQFPYRLSSSRKFGDCLGFTCKFGRGGLEKDVNTISQDAKSKAGSCFHILAVGATSGIILGSCNLGLERFADTHPDSVLARHTKDGIGWRLANYVVPVSVTAGGFALWLASQCTIFGRCSTWWFGSQQHWVSTLLMGVTLGHYVQEIVANRWSGYPIFAHHLGAIALSLCLQRANAWRGLLLGWGAVYEAGSVLLNFGYLGYIPTKFGHAFAAMSTFVGMGFGIHGLARYKPILALNGPARFCVTTLVCIGAGRIHIAHSNLKQLS